MVNDAWQMVNYKMANDDVFLEKAENMTGDLKFYIYSEHSKTLFEKKITSSYVKHFATP